MLMLVLIFCAHLLTSKHMPYASSLVTRTIVLDFYAFVSADRFVKVWHSYDNSRVSVGPATLSQRDGRSGSFDAVFATLIDTLEPDLSSL